MAAFAYGQISAQKRPQRGLRAEAACVETPAGWAGPRGEGRPAEVLALELGRLFAAISLGRLQALILSLRIADSLGQHFAQLSLGLRRLARERFCPCGHEHYVGMRRGELNPLGRNYCRRFSPLLCAQQTQLGHRAMSDKC